MRKWTKTICLVLTVIAVMAISSVTAFAYADESVIDETFTSVETMPDETTEVTEPSLHLTKPNLKSPMMPFLLRVTAKYLTM